MGAGSMNFNDGKVTGLRLVDEQLLFVVLPLLAALHPLQLELRRLRQRRHAVLPVPARVFLVVLGYYYGLLAS